MIGRHLLLWSLTLLVLMLAGCGGSDMSDLETYARKTKARAPTPIDPLPAIQPIDTFVYEPADRRDPFVPDQQDEPVAAIKPDNGLAPDPTRRKEELESYALDALRMVGTLKLDETLWGLVKTKEGTLHRVRVGNYMGTNNGQIISIGEDAIQLTEIVSDAPGEWRERPASLALTQQSAEDTRR